MICHHSNARSRAQRKRDLQSQVSQVRGVEVHVEGLVSRVVIEEQSHLKVARDMIAAERLAKVQRIGCCRTESSDSRLGALYV